MRIETKSGHTILADDADYPLLGGYGWYASKHADHDHIYAVAQIPGDPDYKRISMHRLLMKPPQDMVVHHKNNNGLDNRRSNLLVTTQRANLRYAAATVKYVYFEKRRARWRAQPRDETGKQISLGMYATEAEAHAVVQNWTYRKMLELESRTDAESLHLAAVLAGQLGFTELTAKAGG